MVFQKVFRYSLEGLALMLDVHHKGRAVVSNGTGRPELDVCRLHERPGPPYCDDG